MTIKPDTETVPRRTWNQLTRVVKRAGLWKQWCAIRFRLKGQSVVPEDIKAQMRAWLYENMTALQIELYDNAPEGTVLPPIQPGSTNVTTQGYAKLVEGAAEEAAEAKASPRHRVSRDGFSGFPLEHIRWCFERFGAEEADEKVERREAPSPAAYGLLVLMRSDPSTGREVAKRCMQETYIKRDDTDADEEWLHLTGIDDRIIESFAEFKADVEKDGDVAKFVKRAEGLSGELAVAAVSGGAAAPAGTGPTGDNPGVQG